MRPQVSNIDSPSNHHHAPMSDFFQCKGLTKSYGATEVVHNVDLGLLRGEVKVIIGPSGSGKSTVLRLLALLEPADRGRITLSGNELGTRLGTGGRQSLPEADLARQRGDIGMVFQNFNLFPHLTIERNVSLGLSVVKHQSRSEARDATMSLLKRVGVQERAKAYPKELSGGQQQRVAIARALVMNPQVMLFDEPTSALDPEMVHEVLDVMEELAGGGMTMLVVTHELRFAREVADTVVMFDRAKVIEEMAPHEMLNDDRHARTKAFMRHLRHDD